MSHADQRMTGKNELSDIMSLRHICYVLTVLLLSAFECGQGLKQQEYVCKVQPNQLILTCPLRHASLGDEVSYYLVENLRAETSTLLKKIQLGKENSTSIELRLQGLEWHAGAVLYCEIYRVMGGEKLLVSRTHFQPTNNQNLTKFVYEPSRTIHVSAQSGRPVTLTCPIPEDRTTEYKFAWFQIPGCQIVGEDKRIFKISQLKVEDFGDYYCTSYRLSTNVLAEWTIQKFQVTTGDYFVQTQNAIKVTNSEKNGITVTQFECPGAPSGMGFVTWEQPPGTVLIGEQGVLFSSQKPFVKTLCSYMKHRNAAEQNSESNFSRFRRSVSEITVNPDRVDARPGHTVRFLCESSAVPGLSGGKLFWIRTDRQGLRPGKEEVIGSTGGRTLLIVNNLDWMDNNVTYVCTDGVNSANAQLFVRDACPPGFRSCDSRECVESGKFCDGVPDCVDGSDEILSKCLECAPNEFPCGTFDGKKPIRKCYLQYWHCDGEDDCGNNFDEATCPPPSSDDKCNGTHYICPGSKKPIARAFLCDGVPDCEPDGEDESECSTPSIIEPSGGIQLYAKQGSNLTMTCVAHGHPPPAISWRYNWGRIREKVQYVVKTTVLDCSTVMNHLTIINIEPEAGGLYTCEAVNKGRALAPDYSVNVGRGGLCEPPMFNDAAWFEDLCLRCYCSNLTDRCYSAKGYIKSPVDRPWKISEDQPVIRDYTSDGVEETTEGLEKTDQQLRVTHTPKGTAYLESDFGLNGSWVESYGYDLKFTVRLFGESTEYYRGAIVAIHGSDKTLYWCPPEDRASVYAIPRGYENHMALKLTERERWFEDDTCTQSLDPATGRLQFMDVLRDVRLISIRTQNYKNQVSFELENMRLEHVIPSDLSGRWVAETEQCECPPGYEGLSCEKCAAGFEKDPTDKNRCRPKCACDECDEAGNCIACPGNRDGPRCQHCKQGFYRPERSPLSEDCIKCTRCDDTYPYIGKECLGSSVGGEDQLCKCTAREGGKLVHRDCDMCELAKQKGIPPPQDAQCESKPEPSPCNPEGTKAITEDGDCICQDGYGDKNCDICAPGYFAHEKRCLSCFCGGQTKSCHGSSDHYFYNITMKTPNGFEFDVWLGQRGTSGELTRTDHTPDGHRRLEIMDDEVTVRHPINDRGVVYLGINLHPPASRGPTENDIPIYRSLYGGQMSFLLDSPDLNPNLLTQGEASVVVELESARFGRIWTYASFSTITQRYELKFDENWWPGGWRLGTPGTMEEHGPLQGLTRGQFLRVLATTTSIAIVTSSGNSEGLRNMKLTGLSLQVALSSPLSQTFGMKAQPDAELAPVEICDCPQPSIPGGRLLSPSCEGCQNVSQRSIIHLEPLGPDLVCGGCFGETCDECPIGQFKYNLRTGGRHANCQTGLTIDTKGHTLYAAVGKPVNIPCRATSYRGGIASLDWTSPDKDFRSEITVVRRTIPAPQDGKIYPPQEFNQSIHRSEAVIRIDKARLEDSGTYTCQASNLGSIIKEPFYLVVYDEADRVPTVPDSDSLNRDHLILYPSTRSFPAFKLYRLESEFENLSTTIVRGTLEKPSDASAHHMVWLTSNGTMIPSQTEQLDDQTGVVVFRLSIPHSLLENRTETIHGYFVGKDPVKNPFWTPMRDPEVVSTAKGPTLADDVINPPAELFIPFMHPGKVTVYVRPGVPPVRVSWRRIGNLSETVKTGGDIPSELPKGILQEGNTLTIWAALKQHEGVYEGTVYPVGEDREIKRINVTVKVEPLNPGRSKELGPGEAVDMPEPPKEGEAPTPQPFKAWDFLIHGFTPDEKYCSHPTWRLVDYGQHLEIDITDRVERLSDSSFRVDYPLSSGVYLRFECRPVPESNQTGEIRFNITSADPRIIFKTIYDDSNSTFPTRLICFDLNPDLRSDTYITSDAMSSERMKDAIVRFKEQPESAPSEVTNGRVELDWRRIGSFNPFHDSGQYRCFVNNSKSSGSKELTVPSDDIPVTTPEDIFQRVYIYSPDTYVSPEVDGKVSVEIEEGNRLRVYCMYDARPLGDFHGWRTESESIRNQMKLERRGYSALAETQSATTDLNEQVLECSFGDRAKQAQIRVTPKGKARVSAKILSNCFVDDRLIAYTGGDMNLTCEYEHTGSKPIAFSHIDWFLQYSNGIRRSALKTKLAERTTTADDGRWIHFDKLTKTPSGAKIFCVVRLKEVATAAKAYYPSQPVELWIRKPKLSAHIEPIDRPGILVGVEGQTMRLSCIVMDLWRKEQMKDAVVSWEKRIVSSREQEEGAKRVPMEDEMPWVATQEVNGDLLLGGVRRQSEWYGEIQCIGKDPRTNISIRSDWARLEVRASEAGSRQPRIRIVAQPYQEFPFYPAKVECVNDNNEVPSSVTWSREETPIPPENIETSPNSATLTWTINDVPLFDPKTHAGIYTCRATNQYGTVTKQFFFPLEFMAKEVIPISNQQVKITSDVNEIFPIADERYTRVIQGHPLELLCTFYGHPPPAGGLRWSLKPLNDTDESPGPESVTSRGLRLRSGRQYWTEISTATFDSKGRQTGAYECAALDENGQVLMEARVRVELYQVYVKIQELSDRGVIEGNEGDDGTITCNAYDGYHNYILPDAVYKWEFEKMNGDRIHPSLLASEVIVEGNHVQYRDLNMAARNFRARCIAVNNSARYVSPDFGFRVHQVYGLVVVKRPEIEWGGTRWIKGDGTEGVLLVISGLHNTTGHVSGIKGDTINLTCTAVDAVTNKPYPGGEFYFGWKATAPTGELVTFSQFADGRVDSYTTEADNASVIVLNNIRESPRAPEPTGQLVCLATRRAEAVTYVSKPVDYVVYPMDTEPDYQKEQAARDERGRIRVVVDGLDSRGMMHGTEGSVAVLKCTGVDSKTGQKVTKNVKYMWEFIKLDGKPVDTGVIIQPGVGSLKAENDQLTLSGLRRTSTIKARCVLQSTGFDEDGAERHTIHYSPYFQFDVTDDDGVGYRDFIGPVEPRTATEADGLTVKVNGLDPDGHLTGQQNDHATLTCTVLNATTNEVLTNQPGVLTIHYGWQLERLNGLPAPPSDIAGALNSDAKTGELQLEGLQAQSEANVTMGRCIAEVIRLEDTMTGVSEAKGRRYASPYFLVNVPPRDEVVPDYVDVPRKRYEVTVRGLNDHNVLVLKPGQTVELQALVRDVETDTLIDELTPAQAIGWQFPIYPSGSVGNPGDVARRVSTEPTRIILDEVRDDVLNGLRGRVWFYDGLAYYTSRYFPIVAPRAVADDGRVRVIVQETGTEEQRRYVCSAYDAETGAQLSDVSYDWSFTTSTGDQVFPSVFSDAMKAKENQLAFRKSQTVHALPINLRDAVPIEGRCTVLYRPYAGDLDHPYKINLYHSDPFILIKPDETDSARVISRPDPLKKADPLVAVVTGAPGGVVMAPEGGTVTLTCEAIDYRTMKPVENLQYVWDIQQRDGSPIDTGSVAHKAVIVDGEGGQRLTLVGIRPRAEGLRGRCNIINITKPLDSGTEEFEMLGPGGKISSPFFQFYVNRTVPEGAEIKDVDYTGFQDFVVDGDPNRYEVVVSQLDDFGRLQLQEGRNTTVEVKLRDLTTGELISFKNDPAIEHFGIESRYENGQPAPLSSLAELITIHGKDGLINLNNFRGKSPVPIQFRAIVERKETVLVPDAELGTKEEKKRVRYASQYFEVVSVKEGEEVPVRPAEETPVIFPVVDGINRCGSLPLVNGANATLICRPNDTRVPTDSLVYSWEIRHSLGESIPYVNFVAKAVTQQNNKLYLVNLQDPSVPLIGRCLITQTKGYVAQFSSPYFRIGGHGPGCEPNEPVVVPDGPGHKPGPGHRYQVLIRVTGLNDVGTVVAKPGENVTLKCEVLNSTTNESIPNASVGFSFVSEADEPLHPGRLASRYELGEDNELRMIGLYPNPNARGRCVVTLQDRVTLGSPYFTYTVQDGEMKHVEPTAPSYADKRVRVEISGLDKYNQISIQRVGEDASLRCQAIVVFTSVPLQPVHGVRYGWEWRYMDEDPVSTSTVAVSLDMNRERLGLRGIRAPAGGKGRNVKGRCVVHVPARQVDPNLPEDQMLVYGSEYFTIDVMQKLTTLDADVPPVPGRPTDGIVVKVKGLQEDGNLAASEKDSTAVTCEVQNATTGERLSTEGLRAEYSAYYGWEFADATGHSVDYSLFADGISTDAGGNLRLRGLSAPTRGDLPYKVRCTAVVTKLPESIDKPSGPAKAYTSKFFALDIKRPDGSSTTDVAPGETPPDIAGDLITLRVDGLRPDGSLSALPGEDEILKCTAEDTKTGEEVAGVIYGWELTRGNGWPLNYGQLAAQVIQDGSKLLLVKVRPLRYEEFSARGRCVAHHGRQLYKSDYFKINIASTPKGQEVEGDGRIRVIVGGVDSENKSARIKLGESSNFTCYAEDALTGGLIPGLEYGWDLHYLTSASGPELQGSLGPFAEAVAEKTNGQLVIHAPSVISPTGDQARFRCRVMNNSMVYTSPFYRISVDSPDLPGYVAEKEVFPKYRVKVTGLDDAGYLAATPGEKSTLKCTAYDSLTGEEIESVQYLWELKRSDGDAASTAELVTRSLHATDRQLEMDGLKLAHYTYKGRCMVRDPGSDSWDSSPYFYFKVLEPAGPELGPEETIAKTQANATDDRVLVKVDGLDPSGNLIGKVGDDSKLTCTARVNEGVTAEIGSRGWIFTDESGDSVPITNIAQNVQVSDTEGMLNLANLRPSKTGKIGEIKGKCVVIAEITSTKTGPDGQEVTSKETTLFQSDSFGVSITADGSPSDNPGGMDVQGRKVVVTVKGLAENGSLIGESGDKLTLSCVVEDGVTGEPVSNGVYSWEIRDSLGRPVTADQVAQNVVRKGNTIEFIHLRPTQNLSLHNQRFGRCVVYISTTDHLYRSAYFHMNVRRPSPRGATGPDDHVEIHINGITEDGILEAQEGDTKTLECTAQNKESKTALSNAESIYHFQFDGADPSRDDLYSGHIADEVTQEPLPEGGIRLILKGIKADTWHRGRCVVLYIPGGQVIEGEEPANKSVKKYTSNYFWPGVVGVSRPVLSAAEIKEEPSVVGGITYDPLIIVKVDKVSENGTILVEPGKDVELRGYAIDALTGRPVKDMVYLWELRTVDEVPLVSNQLADSLESGRSLSPDGQILKLTGYRSTGDGIRVRVLAKATDAVKNDRIRGHTYVSPSYTFQTAKPKEPAPAKVPYPEPKGKYDPDLLQVEVGGLNPDGTLSKKEGESVKLTAQVLDSRTGVPIEDELDVGWSLGTGPDNRPISWTALADSVLLNKSELILDGLKTTPPKTGGLRSHIEVTIPEEMLLKPAEYKNRTVTIKSDSFVIHVEPQDDKKLPVISDTEERDKTPFKNWIPGREPKNAVLVKVLGLKADNRLEVPPGGNLSLSCLASDAVSLRRIVPGDDLKPVFAWEVRDKAGGRLLDYGLLANGEVIITQPEMYASAEDAGKSVLSMYGIRLLAGMDPSFAGRCIVYLRDQIFRSPYFIIEVDQPKEMEDYHISPSDHWTPDTAIEVVVKNLDPDGNKAAFESSSTKLECEARDAKTHQPLANDQVVYGWQLINPINDALMTPLTEKAKISGPYLQMNQMHLPEWERMLFTLWGWCMVDLPSPDKQGEVRHYRSKPFALKIYPKDQEIKPEEEIAQHAVYAKVEGISGDGHLRGTAGEDRRIACHAIDTYTGTTYTSGHLTYGWDWRTLDGSLADIHEIADNIESSGNELHLRSLQATTPIKGRCVIIVRPTLAVDESVQESRESLIPKYYMSDFFFVDVKQAESGAVVTVDEKHPFEAVDQKVIVDVTPHVDDKIKMYANQTAEFQITAKSSDGSPVKPIRYGYELVYLSGQVAHSGEVAESINFDHHEGVLKLKNVQYPAKPIKLRFFAVMSPAETESGVVETEGAAKPHRPVVYRSAYYPVDVEPSEGTKEPKWTDRLVPVYDVSAQAYRVKVDGLDENGNAAGRPKEPMELDCTVFDKIDQEVDLRSNSFTWQLVDQKGNPTNPGNLADEVEIVSGRKLKLTGFRESAMREGIRGRCIINIQVPVPSGAEITSDMPPTQRYASPYFTFTRKEGAEVAPSTEETTGPETSPETPPPKPLPTEEEKQALRGFYLKLDSPVNPIYKTDDGEYTILARVQRPFELSCEVIFNEGFGHQVSSTGEPLPKLMWYYRQPEIPGDVPIPSQLFPVVPPRMETLGIKDQKNYKIVIDSDAYSFRDDVAEFQCNAHDEAGEKIASQIVFIQKVKEAFDVRIFDEDSRGRAYAFVNTDKTLTCYVDDIVSGERVEPESYQWEVNTADGVGEWLKAYSPRQPAENVEGWNSNQLLLRNLKLPVGVTTIEATYEFRCVAAYNSTFETISRPFVMNVRKKPKIHHIRIDREKPTEAVLNGGGMLTDTYDATEDYQLGCKPEVLDSEASAVWKKCEDSDCTTTRELMPAGDKLFLFANSTRYVDEGVFRCEVSLQLKEYNFKLTESKEIKLLRQAAPAIYSSDSISYTINDEMSLQCTDESSSPESTVDWSFEPSGAAPSERKNPILLGKKYAYGRIYIFAIARGQLMKEHSGRYTCTAKNPNGVSSSSIQVTVTEEIQRGTRLATRVRIRSSSSG